LRSKPYHIIIAGAGPGDPELVTIKLANALRDAEIIIVDRLVNPEILRTYANKNASIIPVGKQGHNPNSFSQENINKILTESALSGKKVLRLKGGDVAIYSNVNSEIEALKNQEIDYTIIPGITAASGAAASMKIPLTARNIAPGVQIHTLSSENSIPVNDLQAWAATGDTLVFYMSIVPLASLVNGLLKFRADPDLPIAIIEEATTPAQKVFLFTLGRILKECQTDKIKTPALVIIGKILGQVDLTKLKSNFDAGSTFDTLIPPSINIPIHVI